MEKKSTEPKKLKLIEIRAGEYSYTDQIDSLYVEN
jgi:hypothetical protein